MQPIELAPGIEVQDAVVDFTGANKGGVTVYLDKPVPKTSAMPVPKTETGDVWIAENSAGMFWGWKDGAVQPPADTSAYTTRVDVEHEELGRVQRVSHLDHVVKRIQNNREPFSVMSVSYNAKYPKGIPTRVETVQRIIDTYINGSLGSDNASFWYKYRDDRNSLTASRREKFAPYVDADVVLYKDDIYTWKAKPIDDVVDTDELYRER